MKKFIGLIIFLLLLLAVIYGVYYFTEKQKQGFSLKETVDEIITRKPKPGRCARCNGKGWIDVEKETLCPMCKGRGFVKSGFSSFGEGGTLKSSFKKEKGGKTFDDDRFQFRCPRCNGKGNVKITGRIVCPECNGKGYIN